MRLIDADELKKCAIPCEIHNGALTDLCVPLYQIDNAPTVLHDNYSMGYQDGVRKVLSERPTGEWIPINEETLETLQDHHYYLVAHKYFNTPMKAKYHNDCNKHFEVFFSKGSQIAHIFFESTDDITHFMELPELPEREEAAADE